MLFSVQFFWKDREDLLIQSPEFIGALHCQILVFLIRLQEMLFRKAVSGGGMVQCEILRWLLDENA